MPRVFKVALPEGARDRRGWHFPLFVDAETAFHRRWFDDFRARFRAALVVARFSGPLAQLEITVNGVTVLTPKPIAKFVNKFDNGDYPDLDENPMEDN